MDKVYCYPGTDILKNKFKIKDEKLLSEKERKVTALKLCDLSINPIKGNFDLKHLQNIHKYLFQDIYDWAGNIRTVDISKINRFCLSQYIDSESNRIFSGIKKDNYLKNLNIEKFSDRFSYYASEINALHPFREGNGRSTREYLRCLADNAGYTMNFYDIDKDTLLRAFIKSFTNYSDLKNVFKNSIINNIKSHYLDEVPAIKYANESLLDNLHLLKSLSGSIDYISFKDIKALYKILGSKISKGEQLDNDKQIFNVISNVCNEIKILNVQALDKDLKQDQINKSLSKNLPQNEL